MPPSVATEALRQVAFSSDPLIHQSTRSSVSIVLLFDPSGNGALSGDNVEIGDNVVHLSVCRQRQSLTGIRQRAPLLVTMQQAVAMGRGLDL